MTATARTRETATPPRDPTVYGSGWYGIVPAELMDDSEMSFPALWLLATFCIHADKRTSLCRISVRQIAEKRGVTQRAVRKWLLELERAGRVTRHGEDGKAQIFRVVRDPEEMKSTKIANRLDIERRRAVDGERCARGRQQRQQRREAERRAAAEVQAQAQAQAQARETPVDNLWTTLGATDPPLNSGSPPPLNSCSPPGGTPLNSGSPISVFTEKVLQKRGRARPSNSTTETAATPKARHGVGGGGGRAPRRRTPGQAEMLLPIEGGRRELTPSDLAVIHHRFGNDRWGVAMNDLVVDHLSRITGNLAGSSRETTSVAGNSTRSEAHDEGKRALPHSVTSAPMCRDRFPPDPVLRTREDAAGQTEPGGRSPTVPPRSGGGGGDDPPLDAAQSPPVERRARWEAGR